MSNERTQQCRRRYKRMFCASVVTLVVAVGSLRVIELGYRGDKLLILILAVCVAGLLFLFFVGRSFAYLTELKRLAMIQNQRAYGGGREFVQDSDARDRLGDNDNIWGR